MAERARTWLAGTAIGWAAVLLLTAVLPSQAAQATDIYRSVDAQGHVKYSDTPSPGAQLVHIDGLVSSAITKASAAPAPHAPGNAPAATARAGKIVKKAQAQRAVDADLAHRRAAQCTRDRAVYQRMIQARHLYTTGSHGQRVYLSAAAANQMRVNTRLQMQADCQAASSGS